MSFPLIFPFAFDRYLSYQILKEKFLTLNLILLFWTFSIFGISSEKAFHQVFEDHDINKWQNLLLLGSNAVHDALMAFSLLKNTSALLSTDAPKGAILSINGIRVISITWVIIGHAYSFAESLLGIALHYCITKIKLLRKIGNNKGTIDIISK